ncbi:hypothetical protein GGR54DRAFT_160980 [Hypoxylon sp. NC1633]|nr:hypothetical protein GGR54DRAFT_160980 [Hypoxylon sp. NC1633]
MRTLTMATASKRPKKTTRHLDDDEVISVPAAPNTSCRGVENKPDNVQYGVAKVPIDDSRLHRFNPVEIPTAYELHHDASPRSAGDSGRPRRRNSEHSIWTFDSGFESMGTNVSNDPRNASNSYHTYDRGKNATAPPQHLGDINDLADLSRSILTLDMPESREAGAGDSIGGLRTTIDISHTRQEKSSQSTPRETYATQPSSSFFHHNIKMDESAKKRSSGIPQTTRVAAMPADGLTSLADDESQDFSTTRECRTCRNRRKECDGQQPECSRCIQDGFVCQGFERPDVSKENEDAASASNLDIGRPMARATLQDIGRLGSPGSPSSPPPNETTNRQLASAYGAGLGNRGTQVAQDRSTIQGFSHYSMLRYKKSYRTMHKIGRAIVDGIRQFDPGMNWNSTLGMDWNSSVKSTVTYVVDWDIEAFLQGQEYSIPGDEAIANAITLTGTHTNVQALSCRQYMVRMWPGRCLDTLELLQGAIRSKRLEWSTVYSSMKAELHIKGPIIEVTASGKTMDVARVGEQLAWLGAALRSSSRDTGVVYCTPTISSSSFMDDPDGLPHMSCHINYKFEPCETETEDVNGQCWHGLFADPVIVQGFQMLRIDKYTGLEVPLDMLVALARARYIDTFKSKIFIKGFSTMLVPTKRSENFVIWHLIYNKNPDERISYLDCNFEHADVKVADLEKSRHILGWCSDAVSVVGTSQAEYKVGRSRLHRAPSGCALEKVEITAGQFVTGTAAFTLGNREKPVHISRSGYLTRLQWISSKHFIFWDEGEKRGWLVNGANALLHILRASLKHSKRKFRSVWLLDPGALGDAIDLSHPDSALQVLISEKNRDLELYIDKTEVYDEKTTSGQANHLASRRQTRHYRLEDQIEHIYNILEKLIDHQNDIEARSGLQINPRPRRQLEGWDFKDLVTDGDPLFPRVATLQTIGKGWVDFTRAIRAVTLFGRGFGDLIVPKLGTTTPCLRWSRLPTGKYYLAVCVSDLEEIMEREGDEETNPRLLCSDIVWHMKQSSFDPCPCTKGGTHKHHEPVQVLFPLGFTRSLKKKARVELESRGAVIFGHNMNIHWHWRDNGDPVKGDPPPQPGSNSDAVSDSGIGSTNAFNSRSASVRSPASTPSDVPSPTTSPPSDSRDTGSKQSSKRRLHDMVSSMTKRVKF